MSDYGNQMIDDDDGSHPFSPNYRGEEEEIKDTLFIPIPGREIEVYISYTYVNDGIGRYEYWGGNGFDAGVDHWEIDTIEPIFTSEHTHEDKERINNYFEDNHEEILKYIKTKL